MWDLGGHHILEELSLGLGVPSCSDSGLARLQAKPEVPNFKLYNSLGLGFGFFFEGLGFRVTGPKPKEIKVETLRIDYVIRTPKVEKLI